MEQANKDIDQLQPQQETAEDQEVQSKKKKREAMFEMALFLILGILIGVTIKTEAVKKVTIGFDDYQLPKKVQSYDLVELKSKLDAEMETQQAAAQAQQQIQQAQNQREGDQIDKAASRKKQ